MPTIAQSISISGIGLHTGTEITVTLHPAEEGTGRVFRVQYPDGVETVPAQISSVHATQLSTELRGAQVKIRTIEHLLSALWGMGVSDVVIGVISPSPLVEMPILDGSAQGWVKAIQAVGVISQHLDQPAVSLSKAYTVYQGESLVTAVPSHQLKFTYGIDFPSQAIGRQWFTWIPEQDAEYAEAIAPARTFTLVQFIEGMRSQGLIKGGSLDNAIVCDDQKWLNPPLRFIDEPCRHKLLDLIGDLSLLGHIPIAHYVAYKASHQLHCQLCYNVAKDYAFGSSPRNYYSA